MGTPKVIAPDLENAELGRAVDFVNAQLRAGQTPDTEELARRFPAVRDQMQGLVPTLKLLHQIGHASPEAATDSPVAFDRHESGRLGDYRIVREIGRGGMGVVYEAEQISMQRRVALKVLPFAAVLDPKQVQRFKNEAQAAGQLHHQNIVPVYSIGSERGVHYYAMQYIEGQTLADVIRDLRRLGGRDGRETQVPPHGRGLLASTEGLAGRDGSRMHRPDPIAGGSAETVVPQGTSQVAGPAAASNVPGAPLSTGGSTTSSTFFRSVAEMGVQAAEALEHAHSFGIVHRDIKPGNLMLDGRGKLWITDFGLAQFQSDSNLTMTGDLLGTIRYMSPEQALAKRVPVDHRTDIYSLGVTLYELLTLEPAFNGSDRQEVLRQIAFEEPRLPRRWNKSMPAELETIVLKSIAKNPAERYGSAEELAEDLGRFLEDKPIKARRPSLADRIGKWSRRHRAVVTMAAGFVVLVAVVASVGYFKTSLALTREAAARRDADLALRKAEGAEARAKQAAETTRAINDFFLRDLLGQANPAMNPGGDKLTVHELLDQAAAKLDSDSTLARQPEIEAAVRHGIGDAYIELGQRQDAIRQLRRALKSREEMLGQENRETIATMNRLAWVLDLEGQIGESESLAKRVVELSRRVLGEEDFETIYALDTLAGVCKEQGKPAEAVAIEEPNLATARRVLGADHPQTLICENNLALLLQDLGKLAAAEKLLRDNLQNRRRVRPAGHPDILATTNNLGFLLLMRGKGAEAAECFRSVFEGMRNLVGLDHPHALLTMGNLAIALREEGQLAEAEPLIRDAFQRCSQTLGPEHPVTLINACKLALVSLSSGQDQEAEQLARQTLILRQRVSGPDHPTTLVAAAALAQVLSHQDKLEEAEAQWRTILAARRKVLGDIHPATLQTLGCLAQILIRRNRPAEAIPLLREAISVERVGEPAVPRDRAEHLADLGAALLATGQAGESQQLLEESLRMHRTLFAEQDWHTASVESKLGGCLAALRRFDESEAMLLPARKTLAATQHVPPFVVRSNIEELVRLYEAWERPAQAETWRAAFAPTGAPRP